MTVNRDRAIGALVGSAVGDALGAPFEFEPAGQFSARFPVSTLRSGTEMVGGGAYGWMPGEFTDDTQMAIILGESLLAHRQLNGADVFARFRAWAKTAKDVGIQTGAVLPDGDAIDRALAAAYRRTLLRHRPQRPAHRLGGRAGACRWARVRENPGEY